MSDIYLSITETPAVVTLSQPVISGALSSTVTVANTVTVALDANSLSALEQVTVTVGAAVSVSNFPGTQVVSVSNLPASQAVTVSNFPSTQTVAGTVTANDSGALSIVNSSTVTKADVKFTALAGAYNPTDLAQNYIIAPINVDLKGITFVDGQYVNYRGTCVTYNPSSTETAWKAKLVESSVTVGNSVTIGSLPAISGTVTANVTNSVTVGAIIGPAGGSCLKAISPSGDAVRSLLVVKDSQSTYGETSGSGVNVFNVPIYGTVTVGNSVTIGAMPNGTLTTRFGTPTTANTAFATSCVTNSSRKYLLIQNVTTGSNVITVGIGFTPTTTQGIQLTAGAGITFESSYIPTGAVQILSSVTASNFTILEA